MKFIKLSLLVLPFMVMADNPVVPMDVDSAEQNSSNQAAQVEERSVEVASMKLQAHIQNLKVLRMLSLLPLEEKLALWKLH